MRISEAQDARREWVRPLLLGQSTLTTVTQVASPVPMSLLFLQASNAQCFNSNGNPVVCP